VESHLLALHLQRLRDRVRVTAVFHVAVAGDDPGLVDAARTGSVGERHELYDHRRRAVVLVGIGVVAAAIAAVIGPGRAGRAGPIPDVARERTRWSLGVVGSADVEQRHDDPVFDANLAALGRIFGQQHLAAGVGHLEVVVAVRQPSGGLGSIRPWAAVQVDIGLLLVADVLIDDRTIGSGRENGPLEGSSRRFLDIVQREANSQDDGYESRDKRG
jgi:hypothetical protein